MTVTEKVDCVVIGAGVVGLAVARSLAIAGRDVIVLEAEKKIGTGISSRNSEVIHAGIYYPEGSLKASFCLSGRKRMYDFCSSHGVNAIKVGKLIVASCEDEVKQLLIVKDHAAKLNVKLEWLDAEQAHKVEPELNCAAALLSPETGIVDSHAFMLALQGEAETYGAMIVCNSPVKSGRVEEDGIRLNIGGVGAMTLRCSTLVNCAGLGAQNVSRAIEGVTLQSVPPLYYAKGSYFYLDGKPPFSTLIYPLPDSASLGIHYTLDLDGQARFGPDIEWVDKLSYTVNPKRAGCFYDSIRQYWPNLPDGALRPGYAGIRPKINVSGEIAHDFVIHGPQETGVSGYSALYGIESPGLTSSLVIADTVVEKLL